MPLEKTNLIKKAQTYLDTLTNEEKEQFYQELEADINRDYDDKL